MLMQEEMNLDNQEFNEATEKWCQNTAFQGNKEIVCQEIEKT